MALDVYVMPLWRFKVGDFKSPIEAAFGLRPKIISSEGIVERPAKVGWLKRWSARREVRAVCKAVQKANGVDVQWNDDGDLLYSEQGHWFEALRAYAKWLDCRSQCPEFDRPPESGPYNNLDYHKHPVWNTNVERLSCPHLVEHSCYSGYFLPFDFEKMVQVEPYMLFGKWRFLRNVGSSPRLLRELDLVQATLQVPGNYDYSGEDPLFFVKHAYLQLREVAELSCRHGLPVIFWG